MTDQKKIAIMDNLLKEATDPQMLKLSPVLQDKNGRFRIVELLIEEGDNHYWISIQHVDGHKPTK